MSFLHYFHEAISNHLSEKAKNMSYFIWSLNTGLIVTNQAIQPYLHLLMVKVKMYPRMYITVDFHSLK